MIKIRGNDDVALSSGDVCMPALVPMSVSMAVTVNTAEQRGSTMLLSLRCPYDFSQHHHDVPNVTVMMMHLLLFFVSS